jgi:hypothetical protein
MTATAWGFSMSRKRTFLLNHELIDGIRFLDGETFKAVICGIADLDEYNRAADERPGGAGLYQQGKRIHA